ncbi:MAG: D-alanyl-D-alanine carboxypeptidase/D-alanyl-D-alanine-endopeptidase, partial [Candidatus Cloacimonetes bacterium]|nr:D-alanyl-D-alanine carboxypeptidase/D-alanyl-D-alanine-endopeptidase [Candidatus Cloacimonadota bacterium]
MKIRLLLLIISVVGFAYAEISFAPGDGTNVGLIIYSPDTGKTVYSHNADTLFSYASNLKLLTAAAALDTLGGGHHFITYFGYDTKNATLYIKGGGNPVMVMEDLYLMARRMKGAGFGKVDTVVVDDFLYGAQGFLSPPGVKERGDKSYLAYISPLSLNYNTVAIAVTPDSTGKKPHIEIRTPGKYFTIQNRAKTVAGTEKKLTVNAVDAGGKTMIVVKGRIGAEKRYAAMYYRKIWHPTHHYIAVLLHYLGQESEPILIRRELADSVFSAKFIKPKLHYSKPLRDIVRIMNVHSSNSTAENLQFYLGSFVKGDATQGVEVLKEFARNKLGYEMDIINGSGLANDKNLLKPAAVMELLKYAYNDPFFRIDFYSSLPVYGEEGTILKMPGFDNPGVARAKSGLLSGVAALSGMVKGKDGKAFLFTFVVNRFEW